MDTLTQTLHELLAQFVLFLPRLVVALVVFVAALVVAGFFGRLVRRALEKRNTDPELTLLLTQLTRWGTVVVGCVVALQQVDFDLTAFLAGLGILGFSVGFAIQDVSKNLVAGLLLLLQQPFDIGDVIEVKGYLGAVVTVDLRATELRMLDGRNVLIPNADVYTNPIVNYGRDTRRRIQLTAGVAYASDLDFVSQTALKAIGGVPGVLQEPAPQVSFDNLGPFAVDFTLYYWIDLRQLDLLDAKDAGVRVVKRAFEEAKIEMPYPTQTVFVRQ